MSRGFRKGGPVLGLDIGTSVTKAAVFNSHGREIAVASSRTDVMRPRPAWSEMDPEALWRAVCVTCRAAVANSGVKPTDIAAVGVAGVMVGAWLGDEAGVPIRPAVLWDDGRGRQSRRRSTYAPQTPMLRYVKRPHTLAGASNRISARRS